jgi:hypothetical protein
MSIVADIHLKTVAEAIFLCSPVSRFYFSVIKISKQFSTHCTLNSVVITYVWDSYFLVSCSSI